MPDLTEHRFPINKIILYLCGMRQKNYSAFLFLFFLFVEFSLSSCASAPSSNNIKTGLKGENQILLAAERTEQYFPLLNNKKVALVANHSSRIKDVHIVDSLISAGINVVKIFTPEHGFRGKADAGEKISDAVDAKTGLPIVSLYGNNKKPTANQLKEVDVVLFDIQDVGARFYTYISTLHYVMEACAENGVALIVLDRPNPNGFYVDGPVLEEAQQSFVGMHPVPVVHGMTIGEYAMMINGENWLENGAQCNLKVVKMQNYDHSKKYQLPVKPSPNLPNMLSVYLYPSLCFFEGTAISVGRGTLFPFQQIGHPSFKSYNHLFIPKSMVGATDPKLEGRECFGYFFNADSVEKWLENPRINLDWLLEFYAAFKEKDEFFNSYFNLLAGNTELKQAIVAGKTSEEIRTSWQKDLKEFKLIRKKYLLYKDF